MTPDQRSKAMYQFIEKYAFAPAQGVPACPIWKGYQNRIENTPPELIVFQEVLAYPKEEGNEIFILKDPATGIPDMYVTRDLWHFTFQLSFRGKFYTARRERLSQVWRSRYGAQFLRDITMDIHGGAAPIGVGVTSPDVTKEEGTTDYMPECTQDFHMAARVVVEIDDLSAKEIFGVAIPVETLRRP